VGNFPNKLVTKLFFVAGQTFKSRYVGLFMGVGNIPLNLPIFPNASPHLDGNGLAWLALLEAAARAADKTSSGNAP
jgi:hypothetical protein